MRRTYKPLSGVRDSPEGPEAAVCPISAAGGITSVRVKGTMRGDLEDLGLLGTHAVMPSARCHATKSSQASN
jgi:hypothetical protein